MCDSASVLKELAGFLVVRFVSSPRCLGESNGERGIELHSLMGSVITVRSFIVEGYSLPADSVDDLKFSPCAPLLPNDISVLQNPDVLDYRSSAAATF